MNVPSGYTALDLIGFTDRGDYVSTDNYVKNDLVHYNGRVWKCRIDDTTAIAPVEGANWTVWIDEAAYLSGLADVTISNPANGEALRYNSQSGKWENVTVDSTPTVGSSNLVQSGGVATQLANKANSADLATVATSGDYQDLNNLPTLADVATTGQYSDLLGAPTIPTVNNGTLTIQVNGANVQTFGANESNNKTANVTVPTKTSDLTNDSNFVSDANYQHITVDSAFSDSSTNPVQNKVVNSLKETFTNQSFTNGAVNMCPNNWGASRVVDGITWTVNDDGTVTVNGAISTSDTSKYIGIDFYLDAGSYKFSGSPSGGASTSKWMIMVLDATHELGRDTGSGITFTLSTRTHIYLRLYVFKSYGTYTNLTFKPMITVADMPNSDYNHYVPYAISNASITKSNNNVSSSTITTLGNTANFDLTNATVESVVNAFTRRISIKADGLVTKVVLASGQAVSIANVESGYYGLIAPIGIARARKDDTYYDCYVAKNNTNNVLAFTAKESIPIGATIGFYIEWPY